MQRCPNLRHRRLTLPAVWSICGPCAIRDEKANSDRHRFFSLGPTAPFSRPHATFCDIVQANSDAMTTERKSVMSDVEDFAGFYPWREFLMTGTRTAKLATVRPDGRAHVAPVAFVLDGDDLLFSTAATSVKGRALLRGGEVALAVDDEQKPYPFVIVEGTVSTSEDLDELLRWCTAVGGRYMGADHADEFAKRNAVPGQVLVRVTPTRIIARMHGQPRRTLDLRKR